jgi:hypothetical protein
MSNESSDSCSDSESNIYESNYSRYLKNKNVGTVIKMKKSKVYEYKNRVKSGY